MKIIPLTKDLIDFVVDHLSVECREEVQAFGVSINSLKERFYGMINAPFTGVFLDNRGNPRLVFGMEPIGAHRWRSHLVQIENGIPIIRLCLTRFFKAFSDRIIQDTCGEIEIISLYGPETPTGIWFKIMGFVPEDFSGEAGFKYVKKGGE